MTEEMTKAPAEELIAYMNTAEDGPTWAVWEPGDFTRYKILKVDARPLWFTRRLPSTQLVGLLVTMDEGLLRDQTILVMKPHHDYQRWHAALWLQRGYPPGWWGAIRPLLSALEWVVPTEADVRYSAQAGVDIGKLMDASEEMPGDDLH